MALRTRYPMAAARWIVALAALLLVGACATPPPAETGTAARDTPPKVRELIAEALALLGTPYRYGGASPDTGFDCSGLVRYVVGKAAGLKLPGEAKAIAEHGVPVEPGDLRPGDLVFFNTLRRPYSHVGIYLGDQRFVHAPSSGGVVEVVHMGQRYWRQRYEGARRLPF